MKTAVLAASGLLIAIGSVPYLIETLRGTAKPQVVSWAVWAALLAIGSAAALSSGQVPAAVYGALCAAVDALVAVLALRGANLAFRRLDFLCLAGAMAGLVLLATVRAPAAAVAVSVAADLIAYIPTMVHAWREPHEETWSAYALYAAAAWLALTVADFGVFTAVAYPAYLAVADTGMTGIILARRALCRNPVARPLLPETAGSTGQDLHPALALYLAYLLRRHPERVHDMDKVFD